MEIKPGQWHEGCELIGIYPPPPMPEWEEYIALMKAKAKRLGADVIYTRTCTCEKDCDAIKFFVDLR